MPDAKRSVFISYASSDKDWAQAFARSLQKLGQDVWTDWDSVNPGESIQHSIENGLRESNLIVLMVTPSTVDRPNLFFEMGAALGMGKPVVLVRSEDVDIRELPSALRDRKFLLKRSPEATAEELVQGTAA